MYLGRYQAATMLLPLKITRQISSLGNTTASIPKERGIKGRSAFDGIRRLDLSPLIVLSSLILIPIRDSAVKKRDEEDASFGSDDSLNLGEIAGKADDIGAAMSCFALSYTRY